MNSNIARICAEKSVTIYKFAGEFGALEADVCDLGRMKYLLCSLTNRWENK
jgi:hypothetical protein